MSTRSSKPAERHPLLASLALAAILLLPSLAAAQPRWLSVPDTPSLPEQSSGGHVDRKDALLWYATYGDATKAAVLLLHGGGGSSDYWAHLVRDLASDYHVIVFDCRGQGRSTNDAAAISYEQMAADAIGVLDQIGVTRASVVGWSDGANIGFYLALRYPDRIAALAAFAGNASPAGYQPNTNPATMAAYVARAKREYETLSPHPSRHPAIMKALAHMWRTQPALTAADLKSIAVRTVILHAEHDEVIRLSHSREIASHIPNGKFVLLRGVSHFALLQDPAGFNEAVRVFLAER